MYDIFQGSSQIFSVIPSGCSSKLLSTECLYARAVPYNARRRTARRIPTDLFPIKRAEQYYPYNLFSIICFVSRIFFC
jgi:hypothetical protein